MLVLTLTAASPCGAAVIQETFETDPVPRGWGVFGDATLFRWNSTNQNLDVTWDSSRPNSFFHLPLGTIMTKADDFSFGFDVRLSDISHGNTPGKPNEFQIAIGLLNHSSATHSNAFRGAGQHSIYGVRNLVEFDYFPDAGFGETFATTVVSTNNRIYPAHNFPLQMTTGDTFRITFSYSASNQLLRTTAARNGAAFGMPPNNTFADVLLAGKNDFRVDTFAVMSYSDAIQTGPPAFHGSVLAHGIVDNVQVTLPNPPVSDLQLVIADNVWRAQFISATNWVYVLERTSDLRTWAPVSAFGTGTGSQISLQDTNTSEENTFFRIRAERP